MKTIRYSSNNSGGKWWLTDDDWKALEKSGWRVSWCKDGEPLVQDGRLLGALAQEAYLDTGSIEEAQAAFMSVVDVDIDEQGCECCGPPHNFYDWTGMQE